MAAPIAVEELDSRAWTRTRLGAFRFAFAYLHFYMAPFPFGSIPGTGAVGDAWKRLEAVLVPWFGRQALRLSGPIVGGDNGSADKVYDWVRVAMVLTAALAAALIWTLADPGRAHHRTLSRRLNTYLSIGLGWAMLEYGMAKIFLLQFPPPGSPRLMQTYGESSPMGLLWTFIGASPAYEMFGGFSEALGGAPLFFRRTRTAGAVIVAAVMSNVVMLNFCYDVAVKINSTHILLIAAFVAAPALGKLAGALLQGGERGWAPRLVMAALLAAALFATIGKAVEVKPGFRARIADRGLNGTWEVEEFVRAGRIVPASTSEPSRWRKVAIEGRVLVRRMDDSLERYGLRQDQAKGTLELLEGEQAHPMSYAREGEDQLLLQGSLRKEPVRMRLRRLPAPSLLLTRGFHWISEAPFAR